MGALSVMRAIRRSWLLYYSLNIVNVHTKGLKASRLWGYIDRCGVDFLDLYRPFARQSAYFDLLSNLA